METGCGGYIYTSVVTHSFSLSFALSGSKFCFSFVLLVVFRWLALYCRAKHDTFRLPGHTQLYRQLHARNPSEIPLSFRGGAGVYISAVSMAVLHDCHTDSRSINTEYHPRVDSFSSLASRPAGFSQQNQEKSRYMCTTTLGSHHQQRAEDKLGHARLHD